jgi:hypothetical protein
MASSERSGWLIAVVGLAGVIGGALINNGFNYLDKKADVDAKMIELSVGILRTEATPDTRPLREWAIDVIEKRAGFNFDQAQKAVLLKQELPYRGPSFTSATSGSAWAEGFSKGFGAGQSSGSSGSGGAGQEGHH